MEGDGPLSSILYPQSLFFSRARPTSTEFLELHLRWLRRGFLGAESLANFQAQQIFGGQIRRKKAYAFVIRRNAFDVTLARHRDAVVRAFQLSLQVAEVLIGFQFGILFNDDQQS